MVSVNGGIIFQNIFTQLIFVMEKRCVLFEIRTEVLNIAQTGFSFKRLIALEIANTGNVGGQRWMEGLGSRRPA